MSLVPSTSVYPISEQPVSEQPVSEQPVSEQFVTLLEQLYQERFPPGKARPTLTPYYTGQNIPLQHQSIYIICRGIIQLHTIHADGGETIFGLCGPSTVFGPYLSGIHPSWATALTNADILPLAVSEVEASPALSAALFPQLVRRLQQTEAWLEIAGKKFVADRLRSLVIQLAQEFGYVGPNGVRIKLRLTHHQLATIISTTRVTVTRLLRDFKDEGWLQIKQRQLIVSPQVVGLATTASNNSAA